MTNTYTPSVASVPRLGLNRKEAAVSISISARKLDELVADRTSGIPFMRVGNRLIFPTHALKEWLSDRIVKRR